MLIEYHFEFADGRHWQHRIDPAGSLVESDEELPEWTRLGFRQCDHCPLREPETAHCPFAVALVKPVEVLAQLPSYEQVQVRVLWRGRDIRQRTSLQRAFGSLLGALGATSGCPHTRMLQAMAWFHLPFSGSDETLYRVLGTHLLGQYLRQQRGLPADWALDSLRELYRNLRQVNLGMTERLRAAAVEDSGPNGMILLDLLAADTLYLLDQYEGELDRFFEAFFE
ncbi:DUF6901 family protein [Pseudomonas zhanjiangensis]|uniref:Uncharacterized protein n=1 Tax=Pseudomonas zhanjiangensis TaxID=3239015 RepID=A0ABV3YTU7_9PSED